MWECHSESELPAKLEEAAACAVHIQEHYGIRTTDVGVKLKGTMNQFVSLREKGLFQ